MSPALLLDWGSAGATQLSSSAVGILPCQGGRLHPHAPPRCSVLYTAALLEEPTLACLCLLSSNSFCSAATYCAWYLSTLQCGMADRAQSNPKCNCQAGRQAGGSHGIVAHKYCTNCRAAVTLPLTAHQTRQSSLSLPDQGGVVGWQQLGGQGDTLCAQA